MTDGGDAREGGEKRSAIPGRLRQSQQRFNHTAALPVIQPNGDAPQAGPSAPTVRSPGHGESLGHVSVTPGQRHDPRHDPQRPQDAFPNHGQALTPPGAPQHASQTSGAPQHTSQPSGLPEQAAPYPSTAPSPGTAFVAPANVTPPSGDAAGQAPPAAMPSSPARPRAGSVTTTADATAAPGGTGTPAQPQTPIESPQFIPQRNPQLREREKQLELVREMEKRARSSSADAGVEVDETPAEERAQRRANRRFIQWAAAIGGALTVLAFLIAAIVNPFGTTASSSGEAEIAHPTYTTLPASRLEVGQCMAEFESAWAVEFVPADCTSDHAAQFYASVPAAPFAGGEYPGEAALRSRAQLSCQAPAALDPKAREQYPDLVIDVAYAPSALEWGAGDQEYRCFASRENDRPLTSSFAKEQPGG